MVSVRAGIRRDLGDLAGAVQPSGALTAQLLSGLVLLPFLDST